MRTEDVEQVVIESRPQVRAERALAQAEAFPPKGYRKCTTHLCVRWTSYGTVCNLCSSRHNGNINPEEFERINREFGPDWMESVPWYWPSKPPVSETERLLRAIVEASKHGLEELSGAIHQARSFLVSKDLGR